MSSSTSSPNTIRLRSRGDRPAGRGPGQWLEPSGGVALVGDEWSQVDRLETLAYCDHDPFAVRRPKGKTSEAPTHHDDLSMLGNGPSLPLDLTETIPSLRLDELIKTQALSPTALALPPDAFRPARSRSLLEERTVRAFDIIVAVVGLVVLSPIMLLVALAVVIDSGGPVFYGSGRIGHRKPSFLAWKFRSMRLNADEELARLLDEDPAIRDEYETYHKLRRDPRLTRVGGFIRQTSLDELPQLWNVLRGEMSIVGPRPKLPVDAACYGPALDTVLSVRPGLTGLWQVSGRNDVTMRDRVLLDLRYVHDRTLRGDLWICLRTAVILCKPRRHGAY